MNIGALIIALGFLINAILDGIGLQIHISKKYRGNVAVKGWQKKRVFADILVSAGAWVIFFSPYEPKTVFIIGVTVTLVGFILLFVLDSRFKKSV